MTTTIDGPVGLRNLTTQVRNLNRDQKKIIDLLLSIDMENGGLRDVIGAPLLLPGSDGSCPLPLAQAIWNFQGHWQASGLAQDGVVDPNGKTIQKLNQLAAASAPIVVEQFNPPSLTQAHLRSFPVVAPVSFGGMYEEMPLDVTIHEFLFRVQKGSTNFWVGAAVPLGTTDFTRAQVYFHPTVVQGQTVHATEGDYPEFKGGWPGTIQRYVPMEGSQLAGARLMTLLVPFTTMGALSDPGRNMFGDRPVETLNAVMAAIQDEVNPLLLGNQDLTAVGVSSFSSGISAMRLFIQAMSASGLVKEVTDFDSPFIIHEPKTLTRSPGATSRCYTQHILANPEAGWINLPAANFTHITSYTNVHAIIGFMMYYQAMITSVIL